MTKYAVKHAPDDSDDADHEWFVEYEDGDHLVELTGLRSAEAHVIAWALNAVADGRTITALIPPEDCLHGIRYAGFYCQDYTGPTDLDGSQQ